MLLSLAVTAALAALAAGKTCTVTSPGKTTDAGPLILSALSPSNCGTNGQVILNGFYYVDTVLETRGLNNVEILLSGTIQYSPNIPKWSNTSIFLEYQNATTAWFLSGNNIHLHGGGTIDGNGQVWWDKFKSNPETGPGGSSTRTFARPVILTVGNSTNVVVQDIKMIQSPNWTNFVYGSKNVTYNNVNLTSKTNSSAPIANTDGWDIYRSDTVNISNSVIINGDDCVSFKPNSTNVYLHNLNCTGSHGISVGSLGQYAGETDIVANVLIDGIHMTDSQNGARIKVWGGSASPTSITGGGLGYVKNITFQNFVNANVANTVIIDQCYSTDDSVCAKYPSKLTISDIHYKNVTGTSSGTTVVDLECSSTCTGITSTGTKLTNKSGKAVKYVCKNIASTSSLDFTCSS